MSRSPPRLSAPREARKRRKLRQLGLQGGAGPALPSLREIGMPVCVRLDQSIQGVARQMCPHPPADAGPEPFPPPTPQMRVRTERGLIQDFQPI